MSTSLLDVPRSDVSLVPATDPNAFLSMLERAAADPNVDVQKMDRLWQMYKDIVQWQAEKSFNAAFAEMQAKLPVITAHGKIEYNGKVVSEYAEFEDINDAIKPILHEHGFGLMFKVKGADGTVAVTPILIHREGHREEGEPLELGADTSGGKNSVQAMGSSTSYAKRYTVIPFLNITTRGEDDDGNAGGAKVITESQAADLQALIDETGTNKPKFLKYISTQARRELKSLEQIPANLLDTAIAALNKKRRA